jgi:hypothetical protein
MMASMPGGRRFGKHHPRSSPSAWSTWRAKPRHGAGETDAPPADDHRGSVDGYEYYPISLRLSSGPSVRSAYRARCSPALEAKTRRRSPTAWPTPCFPLRFRCCLRQPVPSGSIANLGFIRRPAGFVRRFFGFVRRIRGFVRRFFGPNESVYAPLAFLMAHIPTHFSGQASYTDSFLRVWFV